MMRHLIRLLLLPIFFVAGASAAAEMDFQLTSDGDQTFRAAITIDNPSDRKVSDWVLEFTLDREIVQTFGARMTQLAADRYKFTPSDWTKEIAPGGQAKFTFVGKPGKVKTGPQSVKLDVTYAQALVATPPSPSPAAPTPEPAPPKPAWKETASATPAAKPSSSSPPVANPPASSIGLPTSGGGIPHTVAFKLRGAWNNGFTAEIAVVNNTDKMIRPWRLELSLDNKIEDMWEAQFKQVGEGRYVVMPKDYNQELPPGGFIVFGFKGGDAFRSRPTETKLSEGG